MSFVAIKKETIDKYFDKLELLESNRLSRFANRGKIKTIKAQLQALEEGQRRDVLVPSITGTSSSTDEIDKNRYATYSGQITKINEMYNNESDYGGDFLRALLDTRISFIAGAGITILKTRDDAVGNEIIEWIKGFFDYNKYFGSRFIEDVLISELEGKCLLTIFPKPKDSQVRIRSYMWYKTAYNVKMEDKDNQEIKSVTYQKDQQETETKIASNENLVYIKIGGTPDRINRTVPRIANVLTDVENISRSKYDLRKNNHLFARVTPYFQTETKDEAKSLLNRIQSLAWRIGRAFTGTAKFSLVEPTGNALNALKEEITQGMKIISLNTGIPVHLLAYPELLSNRATAENMLEMINAATLKERTKWEEALKELIQKAMVLAFDRGWLKYNDPDAFTVRIDLTSYANLKQLIELWQPLELDNIISTDTFRSMIPGIDPQEEKKLIEAQKKENMERMAMSLNEGEDENEDNEEEKDEKEEE